MIGIKGKYNPKSKPGKNKIGKMKKGKGSGSYLIKETKPDNVFFRRKNQEKISKLSPSQEETSQVLSSNMTKTINMNQKKSRAI